MKAPILGIETSCDETAAAVVADRKVLSNVVRSQIQLHAAFGGVIPELAGRAHAESIAVVIQEALDRAGCGLGDLGGLAVTHTPGLVGSLLVGLSAAKGLSLSLDLPLVGVNHLAAHVYAAELTVPKLTVPVLEYPLVGLVASGGHTLLLRFEDPLTWTELGGTVDDAAGECLDKTAALLGLPYPGGPHLEKAAAGGNPAAVAFPRSLLHERTARMSFSGLKTAVLYHLKGQDGGRMDRPQAREGLADLAASIQAAVVDVLVGKSVAAALREGVGTLVAGGGVTANSALRGRLAERCKEAGLRLVVPPMALCTDNAAMIAGLGSCLLAAGRRDGLDLEAVPT